MTIFKTLSKNIQSQQIELVVEIFRHGARQALMEYPSGLLEDSGKVQQYNYGQILRQRYIHDYPLLKNDFDPEQIFFHTSPKLRAKNSLFWLNAGLYPIDHHKYDNQNNVEKLEIRGITSELPPFVLLPDELKARFRSQKGDYIYQDSQVKKDNINFIEGGSFGNFDTFYHAYNVCPFIEKYQSGVKDYAEAQQIIEDGREAYKILAKYFNENTQLRESDGSLFELEGPKLKHYGRFLDYYACNSWQDQGYLEAYTPEVLEVLRDLKTRILELKFAPEELKKIAVTEHFDQLRNLLSEKFGIGQRVSRKDLKMILYSCHDRNVMLLMMALISDKSKEDVGYWYYVPPFSSALQLKFIVEGEQIQDNQSMQTEDTEYDINQVYVEISLNDIKLEWKTFNLERITLDQLVNVILPQNSFSIQDFVAICSSKDLDKLRQDLLNEHIKLKDDSKLEDLLNRQQKFRINSDL